MDSPQPLNDLATLLIDAGPRLSDALARELRNTRLESVGKSGRGLVHVRDGKSRFARRHLPLQARTRAMLADRKAASTLTYLFAEAGKRSVLMSCFAHLQKEGRESLQLPPVFVLHCVRHTYGTR